MYLVTGGAGFIGSNITRKLVDNGGKVRVLDNLSTGKLDNLDGYLDKIDFVKGDITFPEKEVFRDVRVVFHQAAVASVESSVSDPAKTELNNVLGTVNVLRFAAAAGVKKVVIAGSAAVYGDPAGQSGPIDESVPVAPLSPYAFSKYAAEYYSGFFSGVYGLEAVVLRYFNVFGPHQDPSSDYSGVISKFTDLMIRGERPVVYGDGKQTRDFVFVSDVVEANILASEASLPGRGAIINIGCGRSVSLLELVEILNDILNTGLKPLFDEPRRGDVRFSTADINKARRLLGYAPKVDFAVGLRHTVEWIKS